MCMGRSGGADPGGALTRPSPGGLAGLVAETVLDGRALFVPGAADPDAADGATAGSKRAGDVLEPASKGAAVAGDAWEVSPPVPSVRDCAWRQHLRRGLMGRCRVVQGGAPWRPAGSGAFIVPGPGGVAVTAEWADPGDSGGAVGGWEVTGNDALHALLDDALAQLRRGGPAQNIGHGASVVCVEGPGGALLSAEHVDKAVQGIVGALDTMEERVDHAYGQAVRVADADITLLANARLQPAERLRFGCSAAVAAQIDDWEPGQPLPVEFDIKELTSEMSEETLCVAQGLAAARNGAGRESGSDSE